MTLAWPTVLLRDTPALTVARQTRALQAAIR
jgi:hypothetical protein